MATPTQKADSLEAFLTAATGLDRRSSIVSDTCVFCSVTVSNKAELFAPGEVDTFRDEISRREYTISGLCQNCQDKVFGICSVN
jgi:hypothetical protein